MPEFQIIKLQFSNVEILPLLQHSHALPILDSSYGTSHVLLSPREDAIFSKIHNLQDSFFVNTQSSSLALIYPGFSIYGGKRNKLRHQVAKQSKGPSVWGTLV
eukprot:Gregarina_sp_Poly_1__873@NODE_1209_length_4776_cov_24_225526_g640_i2_p4_GENE_NODE_1209_length_4776_cov_24_225526_g640_i2NODE_1209_length_4776_cov_24_225526_g640_i2_p4_ORF_typecomplete_len103_score10_53_NODE_1209_length_4776_cov_24_225526_g640_i2356664